MAIFRLEAKIIGRRAKDKAGRPIPGKSVSVVAKAAYRAGENLHDDRQDRNYNYRSRAQQVVHTEIVLPDDAPAWLQPNADPNVSDTRRERLWNEVERAEKRVDSQLAREFVIALPVELEREQQVGVLRQWCREHVASGGFVADFAVHSSRDGNNPHGHVLCTLRPVEGEGFGKKPDMTGKFFDKGLVGQGAKSDLEDWRTSWESLCNEALERAGSDARIDHRSLKEQGIDRDPEPKIGVEATGMQRRGAEEDPDRVREARRVRMENTLRENVRTIQAGAHTADVAESESLWGIRLRGHVSHAWGTFKELLADESSGPPLPMEKPASNTASSGVDEEKNMPVRTLNPQPVGRTPDLEPER
jgi:hypothetical protein